MKKAISRIVAIGMLAFLGACDDDACLNGAGDSAIDACTRIIDSGWYGGHNLAMAFNSRGNAYEVKRDHDRAIADYDQAIRLDPKYSYPYNNRGIAYEAKGDHDGAIVEYNQAIELDPKYEDTYINRGTAYLSAGELPKALADFDRWRAFDPKDAYAALWLDIANSRSNLPSHLAEQAAQLDMSKWPAPVVRLYLGEITPDALFAEAAYGRDAETTKGQVCEANFYSGELARQQGEPDNALRLFRLAASDCPKDFIEWRAANEELKALGATP